MIRGNRLRQLLLLVLFAAYGVDRSSVPVAAADFCDQICSYLNYCGWGCYDETGGLGLTDCWTYTGGDCDETYPSCAWPYSSGNWPISIREQIGHMAEPTWLGLSFDCVNYFRIHAVSLCGLGEHDFCEKDYLDQSECFYIGWGHSCDELGINDCYPGNDCH